MKTIPLLAASGAVATLAFAPFGLFPLNIAALAVLFAFWLRAPSPQAAAVMGFVFGLGLYGAGISFVYVAMHDYGDMNSVLAVLVTLLAAAYLSVFSALAGYLQAKLPAPAWIRTLLVMPALWVLSEWLRGTVFTGFPCMVAGYAQIESPLAGYAPLLGVYGVSLAVALSAGMLALLAVGGRWRSMHRSSGSYWREGVMLGALLACWLGGVLLHGVRWTQAEGEPFKASLLQGNVPQELKFDEQRLVGTLQMYRQMISQTDARLVVLPETALPILRQELPESYAAAIRAHARRNKGDVLIGAFERERGLYYNSVFTLGTEQSQSYRKNHLVPFGEFIPLRPVLGWLINEVMNIPMGDLAWGGAAQLPLRVAGQRVAVDICYEDVFGEEIIRALPDATLLVNVTNDAWYGDSFAAIQHNQIAQMRALETGRMMLRATNTGVTSVIGVDGRVQAMLPQHQEGVLTAEVRGYAGATPYVRWGNAVLLVLLAGMLVVAWRVGRRPK